MVKTANWEQRLKAMAGNIGTIAESQSIYLHRKTGTILDIQRLSYGELRVEVPIQQANLAKIFLIGSKGQNIALKVRMGNRDIEKLMAFGEVAFEELWEVFKDATIVARPSERTKEQTKPNGADRPYLIIDKASGFQ